MVEPRLPVDIDFSSNLRTTLIPNSRAAASDLQRYLSKAKCGTLVFPYAFWGEKKLTARFLAKVSLEALALRLMSYPGYQECISSECQLDDIRRFARFGDNFREWPFSERRIYDEDQLIGDGNPNGVFQVLHEFDFLYTSRLELYFVMAIFGVEFSINLGGPDIEGYKKWLRENEGVSPLYAGRNEKLAWPVLQM